MARLRKWQKRPEDDIALLLWFRDLLAAVKGKNAFEDASDLMKKAGWSGDPGNLSETRREVARVFKLPANVGLTTGGGGRTAIHPTPEGLMLRDAAEEICKILHAMQKSVATPREELRVAVTDFGLHYLVPQALRVFVTAYPDTDVEFVEGEHWELVQMVRDDLVDFAVGPEALRAPNFAPDLLFEMPRALLVHSRHEKLAAWQAGWPGNVESVLADLVGETVCLLTEDHNPDFRHRDHVPPPDPKRGGRRITVPSYPHIRLLVRSGIAIGLGHAGYEAEVGLPESADTPKDHSADTVIELELPPEQFSKTPMYLYFRTGRMSTLRSDAARSLAGAFKTTFPQLRPTESPPKKRRR